MKLFLHIIVLGLVSVSLVSCVKHQPANLPYKYRDQLKIKSTYDQDKPVYIAANVYLPKGREHAKYPAIIFPNSWGFNQYEYAKQAQRFARHGYVVLSYSARGWGDSTGQVNLGGKKDMHDVHAIIDWLIKHEPVDPNRIGYAGISYGGGLSLLAAEHDSRIKAVASLSGWTNLFQSFYYNKTPSIMAANILKTIAVLKGAQLSAQFNNYMDHFIHYDVTAEVEEWALQRSPITYINTLNQRNVAVYMNNNFQDILFNPNESLNFYNHLKVTDKRLNLSQGGHAHAEAGGLRGQPNVVWTQVMSWFDTHLKPHKKQSHALRSGVYMQNNLKKGYRRYSKHQIVEKKYYLSPQGKQHFGLLLRHHQSRTRFNYLNDVFSSFSSGASSSVSLAIIDMLRAFEGHHASPVGIDINKITLNDSLFYVDKHKVGRLGLVIQGRPKVSMSMKIVKRRTDNSDSPVSGQFIAYLYDVNSVTRKARLITYGPMTFYNRDTQFNAWHKIIVPLHFTDYKVATGHYLALGLGSKDNLYNDTSSHWANNYLAFQFEFNQGSQLLLPVVE